MRIGGVFAPISREGSLVLNNLLLTTACATVLVGTLYPLVLESLTGAKISVGPPYFNMTFGPLMIPLLLALPFGPMLAWKRGDLLGASQRLYLAIGLSLLSIVACYALVVRGPSLAPLGIGLGVWVAAGAIGEVTGRIRLARVPLGESWRRAVNLPRSTWGTALAHFGVGVTVVGIIAQSAWNTEKIVTLKPGQTASIAGYEMRFSGVAPQKGPNYSELVGRFEISRNDVPVTTLEPSKRRFDVQQQTVTHAAIYNGLLGDLYLVLGDEAEGGAYVVRSYFNPMVRLIWIGAVFMFLAGLLSLSDRRLRVGAPKIGRRRSSPVPQPAE
jgi:cytochrome c-type biogenesis protein CcmF